MTDSHIDYDAKVQDALRSVVKNVLLDTARDGLMGDHHFYIAFKTQAEGVNIPAHLVSRFPDEMTIVLQHKFWGLEIHDDRFEIGLSFNQKPEHLVIPFDAIVGFVDPSVQFALQFHDESDVDAAGPETVMEENAAPTEDTDDMFLPDTNEAATNQEAAPRVAGGELAQDSEAADEAPEEQSGDQPEDARDNVVALDAFRKK